MGNFAPFWSSSSWSSFSCIRNRYVGGKKLTQNEIQEKSGQYYALAYDSWFVILALQPMVRVINRIPHVITSGVWHHHSLIYTTPTEVRAVFPHEHEVFPLVICSLSMESSILALSEKYVHATLRVTSRYLLNLCREAPKEIAYRPPGFVTIAAVRDHTLFLMDCTSYKCFSISLHSSLLQFLLSAQAGRVLEALPWFVPFF